MRHSDTDPRARAYDEEARRALVLAEAETITAWQDRITAAGFADVEVTALTDLYELDGVHGVAADHRRTLQHLITARNPETATSRPRTGISHTSAKEIRAAVSDRGVVFVAG